MRCRSEIFNVWRVILLVTVGSIVCVDAKIWRDADMFPLEINEQCNGDSGVTLTIHNVQKLNLTVYTFKDQSLFTERVACLRVINHTQTSSLTFNSSCSITPKKYKFRIASIPRPLELPQPIIIVKPTRVPKFYLYEIDCSTASSPKITMMKQDITQNMTVSYPPELTIEKRNYSVTTTFNERNVAEGHLGDNVTMVIDVHKNLVGSDEWHVSYCELQIHDDSKPQIRHVIFKNFCPTLVGDDIEFSSMYIPPKKNTVMKYFISFKAFSTQNLVPFHLYCKACTSCPGPFACAV